MKFVYPSEGTVRREATTVARTWRLLSRPVRELLVIAVAVATIVGVLWGIGMSVISGLENRLIDRIDRLETDLRRDMAEGFAQSHQRMDRIEGRMDGRMDRIESDIDQIGSDIDQIESDIDQIESDIDHLESDVDAIEKHLMRSGPETEREAVPATNDPALATPDRHVISTGQFEAVDPSPILLSSPR